MERFEGEGTFTKDDFKRVVLAWEKHFGKPLPVSAQGETAVPQPAPQSPGGAEAGGQLTVTAPFLGVFYRSARQGEAPLIEPGDLVEPDQPLALIEVMKTFHNVTAGRRARVVAVLAEDGAPVEYGQPLFTLMPVGPPQPIESAGGAPAQD